MARCDLTGVGISLDEAYILDLTVAHRVMRDLRERLTTLERLTAQLGEKDRITIRHRGGAGSHTRQDRRLVSKSVATALAEACADAELFIPWPAWRARGHTLAMSALRSNPEYGPRLHDLDDVRMRALLDLADEVIRRLIPGQAPPPELRTVLTAGVCAGLSDRTADDVVATIRERAGNDADLIALGVPAALVPALRRAITRHAGDWGDPDPE